MPDCSTTLTEQCQIFHEEREEDMAELRMLNLAEAQTPVHAACNLLIRACGLLPEVSPVVVDILQRCGQLLHREQARYALPTVTSDVDMLS